MFRIVLVAVVIPLTATAAAAREPIVGGPCEGCELVFVSMPETLTWSGRIAPAEAPGEPLRIEGLVTDRQGRPAPGIIVYAYQTDASGVYPPGETRHGSFRGWVRSDQSGRYRFDSIRPGGYPGRDDPQHVHLHVVEPGIATYWIESIVFTDDPRLTDRDRSSVGARGGSGVVTPVRGDDGVWHAERDIVLGGNVPGYRQAAEQAGR